MDRRRFRPSPVDSLESLTLLSGLAAHVHHIPAAIDPSARPTSTRLDGALAGVITSTMTVDTGPNHHLTGSGRVGALGRVTLSGDEGHGYILIPAGRIGHGTIVLSNARGTVTLALTSTDAKDGPGGLPANYTYTAGDGTGQYAGLADHGTARLVAWAHGPRSVAAPMRFAMTLSSAKSL